MPQSPISYNTVNPSGALVPLQSDTSGNLITGQGTACTKNVTAAAVIKASPGRLVKIICMGTIGTGGALTVNDCTTIGAAAAANQIFTIAFGGTTVGTIFSLDIPCSSGITISAIPTGGSPVFAVVYD